MSNEEQRPSLQEPNEWNYSIDKKTAAQYTEAWKRGTVSLVPGTMEAGPDQMHLNAFLFSIGDFKEFIARTDAYNLKNSDNPITGVVCKVGIKPNPFDDAARPNVPCLIFEPLIEFSAPDPAMKDYPKSSVVAGTELDQFGGTPAEPINATFDFSFPCPPTCPNPPRN